MTEKPEGEGRLDLRALGVGDDSARTEAIVGAVMSRVQEQQQLMRYQRHMLAAAAVLAAIATAAIARSPRAAAADDVIVEWATSTHIPTNGELLAAFHGYRP